MKIILHGKNIELTPAIKSFVDEKIGSLDRLFLGSASSLIEARVEVGKPSLHHHDGEIFYAEINLRVGGMLMRANESHLDLYAAIDRVRDEIEIQIKKFKGKKLTARRKASEK